MGAGSFAVKTTFKAKDNFSSVMNRFVSRVDNLGKSFTRGEKHAKGFGSCLQRTLRKLDIVSFGVISGWVKNLASMSWNIPVEAAEKQISAEETLTNLLKNNNKIRMQGANAYLKVSEKLMQQASDIQKNGVIGDEVLLSGMGTLASMGFDDRIISKMTPLIADMSASQKKYNVTAQDTETIAKGLGRAIAGNVGALSRMGIVLDKNQKKALENMTTQQRAEYLYKLLEKRVGGVNAALAKTDKGKVVQFWNNMGDLQERAGKRVIKFQGTFLSLLNKHFPFAERVVDRFFSAVEYGIKTLKPVFEALNGVFSRLVRDLLPEMNSYTPQIKLLFESVFVPACVLAINTLGLLFDTISVAYGAFKSIYQFISDNFTPIMIILSGVLGTLVAYNIRTVTYELWCLKEGLIFTTVHIVKSIAALITQKTILVYNKIAWFGLKLAVDATARSMFLCSIGWGLLIAGVVAGIFWLIKNWDKVTENLSLWWDNIRSVVSDVWQRLTSFISNLWQKVSNVFGVIGRFIKEHFVDALIWALGPIGWIIMGVKNIAKSVRGLKKESDGYNPDTDMPDYRGKNPVVRNGVPYSNNNQASGKIEVISTLNNNTMFPASSSINVMEQNNLKLVPSK